MGPEDQKLIDFILKHQRLFARYFLPKHCFSIVWVEDSFETSVKVCARVKMHWQPVYGAKQLHTIPLAKIKVWKENVNLFDFVKR